VVITINKLVYQSKSVKRLERGFYILTEFAEPKSGEKDAAENAPSIENERATEGNTPSVARH
jgi:hypothetical protein